VSESFIVSVSFSHNRALALSNDGVVYEWGSIPAGQHPRVDENDIVFEPRVCHLLSHRGFDKVVNLVIMSSSKFDADVIFRHLSPLLRFTLSLSLSPCLCTTQVICGPLSHAAWSIPSMSPCRSLLASTHRPYAPLKSPFLLDLLRDILSRVQQYALDSSTLHDDVALDTCLVALFAMTEAWLEVFETIRRKL
jgi:hypothetical protein